MHVAFRIHKCWEETLSGVQGWTDNLGHTVTFASIVFAPVICFGARIRVEDSGIGREVLEFEKDGWCCGTAG